MQAQPLDDTSPHAGAKITLAFALAAMQTLYREVRNSLDTNTFEQKFWDSFHEQMGLLCTAFTQFNYEEKNWLQDFAPLVLEASRTKQTPDQKVVEEVLQRYSADGLTLRRNNSSLAPFATPLRRQTPTSDLVMGVHPAPHADRKSRQGDITLDDEVEIVDYRTNVATTPRHHKANRLLSGVTKPIVVDTIVLSSDDESTPEYSGDGPLESSIDMSTSTPEAGTHILKSKGKEKAIPNPDSYEGRSSFDDQSDEDVPPVSYAFKTGLARKVLDTGPDSELLELRDGKRGMVDPGKRGASRDSGGLDARPRITQDRLSQGSKETSSKDGQKRSKPKASRHAEVDASSGELNSPPCDRCARIGTPCHKNTSPIGKSCQPCHQLKQHCSMETPPPWVAAMRMDIQRLRDTISHQEKSQSRATEALLTELRRISSASTRPTPTPAPSALFERQASPVVLPSLQVRFATPTAASPRLGGLAANHSRGPTPDHGRLQIDVPSTDTAADTITLPPGVPSTTNAHLEVTIARASGSPFHHEQRTSPQAQARLASPAVDLPVIPPQSQQPIAIRSPLIGGAVREEEPHPQFLEGSSRSDTTHIYHPTTGTRMPTTQPINNRRTRASQNVNRAAGDGDDIDKSSRPDSVGERLSTTPRGTKRRHNLRTVATKKQKLSPEAEDPE